MTPTPRTPGRTRTRHLAVCGVAMFLSMPALAWSDPVVTTLPTITIRVSLRRIGVRASTMTLDPLTGLLLPPPVHPSVRRARRADALRLDPATGLMRPAGDLVGASARRTAVHLDPDTGLMVPLAFADGRVP